jgi:hypothetical protein
MRDVDALAVNNLSVARGSLPSIPKSLKPRHIWMATTAAGTNQRRKVVVGLQANPAYTVGATYTIDGITFTTSGRVGEKDKGTVAD